jgi:hypothetical protein
MARFRKVLERVDIAHVLSLGVLSNICPRYLVERVLAKFGKASQRIRMLPAHAVVYLVMALPLWREQSQTEVLRIVCETLTWVTEEYDSLALPTGGAIVKARERLGPDVMRELSREILRPVAPSGAIGAWYSGMRLMSIDGTSFNLVDSSENLAHFGCQGTSRGEAAFPQMRALALVETGTHVVVAAETGPCKRSEQNMASALIDSKAFSPEMLVMADRNFFGFNLWNKAVSTGAKLLWRVKLGLRLPVEETLSDGSYVSTVYDSRNRKNCDPTKVRVISYIINIKKENEVTTQSYRLLTNIFDISIAPAAELAKLYHERWEIETLYKEVKIGLNNNHALLRSKTPDMVLQEFWALLITHFAIRELMARAAWSQTLDPDLLSFSSAKEAIKRKSPRIAVSPPRAVEQVS